MTTETQEYPGSTKSPANGAAYKQGGVYAPTVEPCDTVGPQIVQLPPSQKRRVSLDKDAERRVVVYESTEADLRAARFRLNRSLRH